MIINIRMYKTKSGKVRVYHDPINLQIDLSQVPIIKEKEMQGYAVWDVVMERKP